MTSPARAAVLPPELRADCTACQGLCCVALPFDALQGFGFDKPAHVPCRHLCDDFRCGIHGELVEQGFRGCVLFDCQGAGQRVTRLLAGEDWRSSPSTATRMFEAFSVMRGLHELLVLLRTARHHVEDARLDLQIGEVEAACEDLATGPARAGELRRQTFALLADPAITSALKALRRT